MSIKHETFLGIHLLFGKKSIKLGFLLSLILSTAAAQNITPAGPLALCQGKSITLTVTPAQPVGTTFQWTKDSINIAGSNAASLTLAAPGNYNVKINGTKWLIDTKVIVNPLPNAAFSYSTISGCGKTKIDFTSSSNDGGTPPTMNNLNYSWNFGDGSGSSTSPNPSHTFNPGRGSGNADYNVVLTVTNSSNNCTNSITKIIGIAKTPDPTLNGPGSVLFNGESYFTFCSTTAETFDFINKSSTKDLNTKYIIRWGDGTADYNSSTFNSVLSHTYSVGIKKMTFIVNSNNCLDSNTYKIFVGNTPAGGIAGTGGATICAGDSQKFVISNTSFNPMGTLYFLGYSDGGKDTFNHPVPDIISHIFKLSSCGTNSSNGVKDFNNSYGAYLDIANPCGTAGGSILPIYVSDKPKAAFTASKDSVCERQSVIFTNTANFGNNVQAGICTPGKLIWRVSSSSPGASFTVSSGTLGNDNGLTNPSLWESGSNSLIVTFNTKGVYRIVLVMANNTLCGADSMVKMICVNPQPTASFSLDKLTGCSPLDVSVSGISNTPECGLNKYVWSITYAPTSGCSPSVSGYSFTGGTNSNSQNPKIQFNNPGVYTISLQTFAPGQSCSSAVVQQAVTVKSKPAVSISPISDICKGASVNPSASAACYITTSSIYSWNFTGGSPTTSAFLLPGFINYTNPGNYTIQFSANNECGTTTVTTPIVVKPTPDVILPANIIICAGQFTDDINFSGSQSGTVFSWTNTNTLIGLGASGSGNISSFIATNNGTTAQDAVINVTPILNGCSGQSVTFTIKVNPKPVLSVNSPSICNGDSVTLTAIGADSYTWFPLLGLNATTGGTVIAKPSTTTPYKVIGTFSSTGCKDSASSVITVKPVPVITANATSPTTCQTSSGQIVISGSLSGSYAVNYEKNGVPVTVTLTATSGVITISNLSAGTYSKIRVTFNDCTSNILGPFTLSDPNPPNLTIPVDTTLCTGAYTVPLSFTATNGSTINWTNNAPSIGLASSGSGNITSFRTVNATTGVLVATITATATLNGCSSSGQSFTIKVNPIPKLLLSNYSICNGDALTLTTSGADSYTWSPSTGLNATTGATVIVNPLATTTYKVIGTFSSTGCKDSASSLITVKPVPVITATSVNPNTCGSNTGSIVISGLQPTKNYNIGYLKNGVSASAVLASNTIGVITINGLTAGNYTDIIVTLDGCASNKISIIVLSDPNPPLLPELISNAPFCAGNTLNLTITNPITGGTYSWTGPNGFSQKTTNKFISINNAQPIASGTYSVYVQLNNCISANASIVVLVNPKPVLVVNSGAICNGSTISLKVTGADVYTWSPSTGLDVTTGFFVNASPPNTQVYNITGTIASTGCTADAISTVTVKPIPLITGDFVSPTSCGGSNGSITIKGLTPGLSYSYSYKKTGVPQSGVIVADVSGKIVLANLAGGEYADVKVSLNGCESNVLGPFLLKEPSSPLAPLVASNSPVCSGSTMSISISNPVAGASYVWTGPDNFSLTTLNSTIQFSNVQQVKAGKYFVTIISNNCPSQPGSIEVIINPVPLKPAILSPVIYCQGEAAIALTATADNSNTLLWYTIALGGIRSTIAPVPSTLSAGSTTYYVSQKTADGCEGARAGLEIIVSQTPSIQNKSLSICSGESFAISPIEAPTGTIYNWSTPIVTSGLTGGGGGIGLKVIDTLFNSTSLTQTATYAVTPKVGNCPGKDFTVVINVYPKPVVPNYKVEICSGEKFSVSPAENEPGVLLPAGTVFTWEVPISNPAGAIKGGFDEPLGKSFISQTLTNTTNTPAILTYTITAKSLANGNCPSETFTVKVVVNPKPTIPDQKSTICSGSSFSGSITNNATNTILPINTRYTWSTPVSNPIGAITGGLEQLMPQLNISQTLVNITLTTATLTYTVTPVSGDAGDCVGSPFTFTVTVNPQPSVNDLTETICSGNEFNVVPAGVPSGTNYTWSIPISNPANSITGGIQEIIPQASIRQRLFNNTIIPASINYNVSPSSGPCGNGTFNVVITVNPTPVIPNQSVENCNGAIFSIQPRNNLPSVLLPAGTTYTWSAPVVSPLGVVTGGNAENSPQTSFVQTLFNNTVAPATSTFMLYPVSGEQGKCPGNPVMITAKVNPDAKATLMATLNIGCKPFLISKNILKNTSPSTANSRFDWYQNDNFQGSAQDFPGYTILLPDDSTDIKLVALSRYGCKQDSVIRRFYTYSEPKASFITNNSSGCGPITVNFTNTSAFAPSFKYYWNFGNGQTSQDFLPPQIVYQPNPNFGDTSYAVVLLVYNDCDTVKATGIVNVQSKPKARFTPLKTTGCSPLSVTFNNTSSGVGNSYFWNFGDGQTLFTSAKDSVRHTFYTNVKDTFYVFLIATNPCGSDTSRFSIVVTPNTIKLDFAINGIAQNGCSPHTVNFINNSSGANIFRWDFGDGNIKNTSKNIDTVAHTFLRPGTFSVVMFASNGCSDTSTVEIINVFDKPVPSFTPSVFNTCIGDSILFLNQSSFGATSYLWRFGDGNISVLSDPMHKYRSPGAYSVTLVAYKTNLPGSVCSDSINVPIRIVDSLPVNFNVSATYSTCAPFKVTFTNSFKDYALLEWDFGDGSKGLGDVTEHTYMLAGNYFARLTLKTKGGCTYTSVKQIEIVGPGGFVRIQTGFNCEKNAVRFEAIPANADTIIWDFGDGNSLVTANRVVFHQYENPGIYYATAKFQSKDGCLYTVPGVYEVKIDKIVAGFRYVKKENCGNTLLQFTDTSNLFFGIASVDWNFGDGTTATGRSINKYYGTTGTYIVQQIVNSNSGCSDTIQQQVYVFVRSLPDIQIIQNDPVCTNTDIKFGSAVQSVDSINNYRWYFSNGITVNKPDFSVKFTTPGSYNVQLICGTVYGCYDTISSQIKVNSTPNIKALPNTTICLGNSISLSATGAAAYSWYPNNGLSCIDCASAVASPMSTTQYTVKGSTLDGCYSFDSVLIKVVQPFKLTVGTAATICIGDSVQLFSEGATNYKWAPSSQLNNADIQNPVAIPTVTTKYRVVGSDAFNCFTDTGFVLIAVGQYPTVSLGPDQTLPTGTQLKLTSAITRGPIQQWLWQPNLNLNCNTCSEPVATIKKEISYNVTVTNYFGCSASDSINIKVFCQNSQVYVPNAFTPDGDGVNDIFMVRGSGIMQVKSFRIFSRWGELVFERTNFVPNNTLYGWDGRVKGVLSSADVYAYTVEVLCDDGTPYFLKGNLTLLK